MTGSRVRWRGEGGRSKNARELREKVKRIEALRAGKEAAILILSGSEDAFFGGWMAACMQLAAMLC